MPVSFEFTTGTDFDTASTGLFPTPVTLGISSDQPTKCRVAKRIKGTSVIWDGNILELPAVDMRLRKAYGIKFISDADTDATVRVIAFYPDDPELLAFSFNS